MRILALETSCDESAIAYLDVRGLKPRRLEYLTATQAIHEQYGGVVPEVAAREHSSTVPHLLAAIAKKVTGKDDGRALAKAVDVVAATRGPGLVTSLKIGLDTAKTLAASWNKEFIGVNHIEGHVYSNWLDEKNAWLRTAKDKEVFPALVLVVSGGHTELLRMSGHGRYRLLGSTRDDAAGEAFDKSAKLLGLGYPGGPAISRFAKEGDSEAYDFPRPMIHDPHFDFSFSGFKTAVRYFIRDNEAKLADPAFVRDVAASAEKAIVDVLVEKTVRAAKEFRMKTVLLAGGVAANGLLRTSLKERLSVVVPTARYIEPSITFCTDNAAMIAMAAAMRTRIGKFTNWKKADADAHWELGRKNV